MKVLFLDRDGTLIVEPADGRVDSLEKFQLLPDVIPSLISLQLAGFTLVIVSNQPGLGTPVFPMEKFVMPQFSLMNQLKTAGLVIDGVFICPHTDAQNCPCKKPLAGLLTDYLNNHLIDLSSSFVIGDRQTDMELAKNIGCQGLLYTPAFGWPQISDYLKQKIIPAPNLPLHQSEIMSGIP